MYLLHQGCGNQCRCAERNSFLCQDSNSRSPAHDLVILVKYLDSCFHNMYADTYISVVLTSIGYLTPKLSTYWGSVARYVRGICPGFFPAWNHTLLMQFCLGSAEQISVNRLCVKEDAKGNTMCSFRSNTKWFCSVIRSLSVISDYHKDGHRRKQMCQSKLCW